MKKFFALSMLVMLGFCMVSEARVVYDRTGRKIVVDDTIRGRKRAAEVQKTRQIKIRAAVFIATSQTIYIFIIS